MITKSWKFALPGWILEVVSVVFTAVLCGVASHTKGFLDFHARYTWLAFVILINCAVVRDSCFFLMTQLLRIGPDRCLQHYIIVLVLEANGHWLQRLYARGRKQCCYFCYR